MRKRTICLGLSLAVTCSTFAAGIRPAGGDPLLRPIAPDYARQWLEPTPPVRVFGRTYLVGFGGLNVGLIRTSGGLILIDGAVPQAVPAIEANIRKLGFTVRDIKYILSTEPHYDHASGIAALARDSGATVLASALAARELRAGEGDKDDPQAGHLERYPGITRIRAVRDGETIRLGDTVVTAISTPGHTLGSMSWSWRNCEGRRCAQIVFAASVNPTAPDTYRFFDPAHRLFLAAYEGTFRRLRSLPCDLLITAHPQQSGGAEKLAKLLQHRQPNPYVDPNACKTYADLHEGLLKARLDKEVTTR
ncbi:subclass B3 metallo-beta-lactamase [Sphingobium nicotianae]|uniref:Subclass B3 metallo-beta-lactamase n=1 Tax=Sphingobium nicotianae TaxID=2782607 RepID=A0A9X1DBJ9_9SPHN|nr:subclass B3 metallo-beta-lactamase [Sphingobium nicotianae]MBT2186971.1 subclass B3 metallo-beta-lactamase [Sphingobium nicotianae]